MTPTAVRVVAAVVIAARAWAVSQVVGSRLRPGLRRSFVGVTDKSGDGNEAHLAWALEELLGAGDTRTYVCVMDFAGFGRADLSPAVGRRSLFLFAAHYPERLSAAIVVNAPPLFSALYRLLHPFIDPVTAAKLTMVRTAGGGGAAMWDRLFSSCSPTASPPRWPTRGRAPPTPVNEGVWWTWPPLPGTGVPYIGGMILEARAAAGKGG
ncbi:hypothetical protein I4F81_011030 [Pyropia yezoensis]|uniref:Uncharacterized protein n=1 Tax=Pyropia yezoensis TaxID=2788 RepID=A0ACC3CE97_PYRYE|nr:hypothetical protein I4F81_011030 [Neopyropia yezoensis]